MSSLCFSRAHQVLLFDTFYATRPYARFYVLETIARVPYFGTWSIPVASHFP